MGAGEASSTGLQSLVHLIIVPVGGVGLSGVGFSLVLVFWLWCVEHITVKCTSFVGSSLVRASQSSVL